MPNRFYENRVVILQVAAGMGAVTRVRLPREVLRQQMGRSFKSVDLAPRLAA